MLHEFKNSGCTLDSGDFKITLLKRFLILLFSPFIIWVVTARQVGFIWLAKVTEVQTNYLIDDLEGYNLPVVLFTFGIILFPVCLLSTAIITPLFLYYGMFTMYKDLVAEIFS